MTPRRLADVVAPPYDVVDEQDREKLAARSPYNAIHIELPTDDTAHGQDRYAARRGTARDLGAGRCPAP